MIRILHLSDLHFGRDRPELEGPLVHTVNRLAPDLVAISGDFTQRARRGQFERARAFVDQLAPETLSVPGNHDTPLDNLFLRFLKPFHRYKTFIDRNLEPSLETDEMVVTGVNTVNRFSWQRGRLSRRTIRKVARSFQTAGDRLRVVVLHHPLEHGPEVDKRLMRGANAALTALNDAGADVVLSGHLHNTVTRPFAIAPGCLFVQAGTGLSNRLRGEPNTFNLLTASREKIEIDTFSAGDDAVFDVRGRRTFTRSAEAAWVAD
ncbi:metallophosphoesterase family protein [Palleronia abyssalis]|uniref:3',5'-cyclic adenosine monophosphate phosphodiesterase CpdA n=1 Tax=Palleronia abyssalis TaxID=1501240 RepID=A0A2R8BU51_9RHOB|nr:metallophosphoesterase family protein [Palleronia abyssalis]SPJ23616.1 3',5'-cyclic adenosine monophosphate phosphodiesterase CpdA [Palleronia abyssalis]